MDKNNKESNIFCVILFFTFIIFYRYYGRCFSYDQWMHVNFARAFLENSKEEIINAGLPYQATAYPLYHLFLKGIAKFVASDIYLPYDNAYFLASTLVQSASVVLSVFLYKKIVLYAFDKVDNFKVNKYICADCISIGAVVFVVARCWLNNWRFYQLQCAANPIHNPTILFVRPLGLLAFVLFVDYIEKYNESKKYITSLVLFSVVLVASVLAKPSYAFVFLPAMGAEVLLLMVKNKDIKIGLISFLGVIPSGVVMLWQFLFMRENTGMMSVHISFGSFSGFSPIQVLFVTLVTFPVPIILFSINLMKEQMVYRLSYIALMVGWIQMFFLTNGASGDFSWGYDLSVQMATVVSLAYINMITTSKVRKVTSYLLYTYQVVCGVQYIYMVYAYGNYWI